MFGRKISFCLINFVGEIIFIYLLTIYLFIDGYNQKLRYATTDSMAKFVIIKIIAFFDLFLKCIYYTSTDLFTSNTYEQTQGHLQVTAQVQYSGMYTNS